MNREEFRRRYGPVALIVGASEGIGAAFADQLAERGIDLILVARNAEKLEKFAAEIERRHRCRCRTVAADMSVESEVRKLVEETSDAEVGLLVYNAAFAPNGAFLDRSVADHMSALSVNSRSVVLLSHGVGKRLVSRGRGGIIIMCSLAGMQGSPGLSIYGATKAFDIALAEALAVELRPQGVDVLGCIAGATSTPGYIRMMAGPQDGNGSGRHPFYVMSPERVARTALRRLGRASLVITGGVNKTAAFLMRRLLPRSAAVRMMGSASAPAERPAEGK